jgi:hypothetical protein
MWSRQGETSKCLQNVGCVTPTNNKCSKYARNKDFVPSWSHQDENMIFKWTPSSKYISSTNFWEMVFIPDEGAKMLQ